MDVYGRQTRDEVGGAFAAEPVWSFTSRTKRTWIAKIRLANVPRDPVGRNIIQSDIRVQVDLQSV